ATSREATTYDLAPRLRLLNGDLPPLDQLEHGQERDRGDDAIPDATQQVLQDDDRRRPKGLADECRALLHGDGPSEGPRRLGRRGWPGEQGARLDQDELGGDGDETRQAG